MGKKKKLKEKKPDFPQGEEGYLKKKEWKRNRKKC